MINHRLVILLDRDNSVSIQIRSLQVLYYNNNVHLLWHGCNLRPADFDLLLGSVIRYTGGGKSKFKGFQWQQCPSKWTLLLFLLKSYDYTNVGHYAMCDREKMKTL